MRRIVGRALALLLAFSCGVSLALMFRGIVADSVRRLALRAEERIKAPYVAEAENDFRQRRILFDMRDFQETPDGARSNASEYDDMRAMAKEEDEAAQRVMPKVFPGGYLEDYGKCMDSLKTRRAETDADLAWARAHGQFVPHAHNWNRGRFTEPHAPQVIYEIGVGECNMRVGEVAYTRVLAIFDRWDKLYASFEVELGDSVLAVRDVDGDGVDEVLAAHAERSRVNYVMTLRLLSFKGGGMRVVHDFGIGFAYSAADEAGLGRIITVPVIYYTPRGGGELPEFQTDYYRMDCDETKTCGFMPGPAAWRYLKSGRLE